MATAPTAALPTSCSVRRSGPWSTSPRSQPGSEGSKSSVRTAAIGLAFQCPDFGDVNGDGFDDFLIGASRNDAGGSDSGAAYFVFGKADGNPVNLSDVAAGIGGFKVIGENADDFAGRSVSSLGDVDGDGLTDLLIGAQGNEVGGAAYVVFGQPEWWI